MDSLYCMGKAEAHRSYRLSQILRANSLQAQGQPDGPDESTTDALQYSAQIQNWQGLPYQQQDRRAQQRQQTQEERCLPRGHAVCKPTRKGTHDYTGPGISRKQAVDVTLDFGLGNSDAVLQHEREDGND
ncbi:hypothetical protein Tdes44962_MAKER06667 [Teratosphaeria destructans]|uniref:Uncharacterized protein n=1 Tax=Teratosphaeria destructans TaxID=418781 RepID=A0A9W7T0R4_9PEZI|nr:hypothetical protein Tdes44962_MAKER06667 [Teratosphaeria destructans]